MKFVQISLSDEIRIINISKIIEVRSGKETTVVYLEGSSSIILYANKDKEAINTIVTRLLP
jgi:hypothetical protein